MNMTGGMSKGNESRSGNPSVHQQSATAGSRMHPGGGAGNETKQSAAGSQHASSTAKGRAAAREEKARAERVAASQQRGGLNNTATLLAEAYTDSRVRTPVLFLVAHGVNVFEIVSDFHHKESASYGGVKLQHLALGAGLEELIGARLEQAAQNGDWIVLENLHLAADWLPTFEATMATWTGPDVNPRFRVWASAAPGDDFPASILENSVKVAL